MFCCYSYHFLFSLQHVPPAFYTDPNEIVQHLPLTVTECEKLEFPESPPPSESPQWQTQCTSVSNLRVLIWGQSLSSGWIQLHEHWQLNPDQHSDIVTLDAYESINGAVTSCRVGEVHQLSAFFKDFSKTLTVCPDHCYWIIKSVWVTKILKLNCDKLASFFYIN